MSEFIPVGVTAMRDPMTGELLDAVPLYVERNPETEQPLPEISLAAIRKDLADRVREAMRRAKQAE